MNPPIGLITPVKAATGGWLAEFYAHFVPDTAANVEWAGRGVSKAMAWVPARMVDAVEDMLSTWRNNDNSGKASTSAFIPVVLIAMAGDYTETPSEAGRPVTDKLPIAFPSDAEGRSFRMRLVGGDLRAQVVVVCSDVASAMSIIAQLCLWAVERPRFRSTYVFDGFASDWPVQVVAADRYAVPSPVGEQLSILTVDLTLRASMPLFYGPKNGDVADGLTPPGFAVTGTVNSAYSPALAAGLTAEDWQAFMRLSGQAPGVVLHGAVDQTTEGGA